MGDQEEAWELRAKLRYAQCMERGGAVLEKLRMEKDNLRSLRHANMRAGPMVHQQQQGVCRKRSSAWSSGVVPGGKIGLVDPHRKFSCAGNSSLGLQRASVCL